VGFDCLYGTPDGATKLAVVCQYKWAKLQSDFGPGKYPLVMGRKTPKDHGEPKDRYFVGAPAGRVVVLEDVTTTGGSLLKTVLTLQELGYDLAGAVTLTNRNEVMDDGRHVSEVLAEQGVPYFNLSQGLELLPLAVKKFKPSQPIKQSIIDEFKQYGESEIML
jgi:orotate phosphoribosyltransferase